MNRPKILIQAEYNPILLDQIVEEVGPRLQEVVLAYGVKPLNRYNLRKGRLFGNPRGKERYRVIDNVGNRIVYKDLIGNRIHHEDVDDLLETWNLLGLKELSPLEKILDKVKEWLTPFLGATIVTALVAWLMKTLGR